MKLSPEQIEDILSDAKPSIIEGLKNDVTNSISWDVKNRIGTEVSSFTETWVKANVIPDIEKALIENKAGFVSLGIGAAETIVEELAKALTADLKENLSRSYNRKKIFEALFD